MQRKKTSLTCLGLEMCSVIGVYIVEPKAQEFDLVRRVFLESRVRGLHATGVAYLKGGELLSKVEPIPADVFVERFFSEPTSFLNEDGNLYLIGHCRYSTSDLRYNQPLVDSEVAISHNGVISQELPENWEKLYGVTCTTSNDSELLLRSLGKGSPLGKWPVSSIAAVELRKDKVLRAYRNGKRPLYYKELDSGVIVTSTRDIAKRAGLTGASEIAMGETIAISPASGIVKSIDPSKSADLQNQSFQRTLR